LTFRDGALWLEPDNAAIAPGRAAGTRLVLDGQPILTVQGNLRVEPDGARAAAAIPLADQRWELARLPPSFAAELVLLGSAPLRIPVEKWTRQRRPLAWDGRGLGRHIGRAANGKAEVISAGAAAAPR
jgi:hypothetical protein